MALRAMSTVNLERSIRERFDRRINEIQRNMQNEYQRSNSQASGYSDDTTVSDRQSTRESRASRGSSSRPRQPETSDNITPASRNVSAVVSPDDIAVDADLGVPGNTTININEIEDGDPENSAPRPSNATSNTSEPEVESVSETNDRNLSCCAFYRKHWVGHLITGLMTGFLFILLGVIFLINGADQDNNQFPWYAGLTMICLGIAPCCMAVNRYRYARLYEQERRRALRRLNALRRAHRRNAREQRRRQRPDLPPSYDNLGFEMDEDELDTYSVASSDGSFVLPTYEQFVKKNQEKLEKRQERINRLNKELEDDDSPPPPTYNENNNSNNDNSQIHESTINSEQEIADGEQSNTSENSHYVTVTLHQSCNTNPAFETDNDSENEVAEGGILDPAGIVRDSTDTSIDIIEDSDPTAVVINVPSDP